MSTPARFRQQHVSETPYYRVAIHRTPSDPLTDARLQRHVDEAIEAFRLLKGLGDSSRSKQITFWATVFARAVVAQESVEDVAA